MEVIAKSGLCSAAQSVRCTGSLSDKTGGCWLKTTRKAGYSSGWEKQSNCQCGHKVATAEGKDTTHSLTALSVILPSRWAEGGVAASVYCFGVDADMLNILILHLFWIMANKLFTCHFTLLRQSKCLLSHSEPYLCLSAVTKVNDGGITLLCVLLVVKSLIYEGGTQKLNDKIKVDEIMIELINLV